MDRFVAEFINQRNFSEEMKLNEFLYNAIFHLEESNEFINRSCYEHEQELIINVHWPSMHDMYKRSYEYCCGVLSCFLIGQLPSCEALCRTAIEGAVNLHYVSFGDSMGKQIAYFKDHLATERKQNKNWKDSVEKSAYPENAKNQHLQRIIDKEACLDQYENALRESLKLSEVDFDQDDLKWPSIFDRFREIGKEIEYRTVYAALCSQAHNDAEDILNKIMSRVIGNVSGMEEALWIEQYNFSLYLLLTAIDFHIEASAMYIAKFGIRADALIKVKEKVLTSIVKVIEDGPRLMREKIKINENL